MKKRGIYKKKFSEKQGYSKPLRECLKKRSFSNSVSPHSVQCKLFDSFHF